MNITPSAPSRRPRTLAGRAMKRIAKPVAWVMALAFAVGTGTVATLALTEQSAEATDGTVTPAPPEFDCTASFYEVNAGVSSATRGVWRWTNLTTTPVRTLVYSEGTGWSSGQMSTMAIGPDLNPASTSYGKVVAYHWQWSDDATTGVKVKK
ncbi:MAG: hypothetical protein LBK72_05560, partial [Bifidobacteriaceae bacterium]|nr:hypothetical protein [Bifidobacteriaceae bacterium]